MKRKTVYSLCVQFVVKRSDMSTSKCKDINPLFELSKDDSNSAFVLEERRQHIDMEVRNEDHDAEIPYPLFTSVFTNKFARLQTFGAKVGICAESER